MSDDFIKDILNMIHQIETQNQSIVDRGINDDHAEWLRGRASMCKDIRNMIVDYAEHLNNNNHSDEFTFRAKDGSYASVADI